MTRPQKGQKARVKVQNSTIVLSDREVSVYTLLTQGKKNVEIAEELFVSLPTVKYHLTNVFAKLGVRNRAEAIAYGAGYREIAPCSCGQETASYSEEQIRRAAARLVELGLGERKQINAVVLDLLEVLGGRVK